MTEVWKYRFIYFLLLPATVLVIMLSYVPMVGIKMAFQDYNVYDPAASTWVGLQNFKELFQSSDSIVSIMNTFKISIWSLYQPQNVEDMENALKKMYGQAV